MDFYKTVEKEAFGEFTEQRSRFIGYVKPVSTEEQALEFINEKKKFHWDAKHNVYAYVIRKNGIKRCSDDGEPHGTAGVPVLDVMVKSGVTDAVIVVTRYFGGILLGAGGLVRAYTRGAKEALSSGGIITMEKCLSAFVRCDYGYYGKISSLISSCGGSIDETEFNDAVDIRYHISDEMFQDFCQKLADTTNGSVSTETYDEKYYCK